MSPETALHQDDVLELEIEQAVLAALEDGSIGQKLSTPDDDANAETEADTGSDPQQTIGVLLEELERLWRRAA